VLKRGSTGLIGLIIAGLAVAACLRSGPEVVVYTSEDQVFCEPVLKDFEKASGIKVRAVYDTEETKSTGVALRIVAERDRPQADVFWANEPLRTVMLLMLLVLASLGAERYWLRTPAQSLGRVRPTLLVARLGAWRLPAALGGWAYALVTVVLPLAGLAREAGGGASYRAALGGAASSIVVSVWTAAVAATIVLAAALMLSYLVERTGSTRRNTVDTALLLLFAAPGTVLGVSLILLWNRPGLTGIYTSVVILLIADIAHYTPVAVRAVGVALQSISPAVEHAARLAGVPWITMVRRVLVPILAPALAGVWGVTFVLCLRDLDLAMTVHPPGVETLPIRVYTLMANGSTSVTAELALLMVALTLAIMLVGGVAVAVARRVSPWSRSLSRILSSHTANGGCSAG
jgi:ABC-type Fe3+ transport system permease subunit